MNIHTPDIYLVLLFMISERCNQMCGERSALAGCNEYLRHGGADRTTHQYAGSCLWNINDCLIDLQQHPNQEKATRVRPGSRQWIGELRLNYRPAEEKPRLPPLQAEGGWNWVDLKLSSFLTSNYFDWGAGKKYNLGLFCPLETYFSNNVQWEKSF